MAGGIQATPSGRGTGLAPERAFLAASALLFLACASSTVYWSQSMSAGMALPGGLTLSMAWVRMPGQTWPAAAAIFLATWIVMMAAMMLPSLVPMLVQYRRSLRGQGVTRLGRLTALAGAGYLSVWAIWGAAVYVPGALLATAETQSMALASLAPYATGIVLLAAGGLQLTAWKAHQLSCVPEAPVQGFSATTQSAWQYGLRLGRHCSLCCSGLMLVMLVTGVMDLGIMVAVAAAITVEQVVPMPERIARAIGIVVILAGIFIIIRAIG